MMFASTHIPIFKSTAPIADKDNTTHNTFTEAINIMKNPNKVNIVITALFTPYINKNTKKTNNIPTPHATKALFNAVSPNLGDIFSSDSRFNGTGIAPLFKSSFNLVASSRVNPPLI